MNNKKVTIVTPTFNSGEYLEDCINSIKNQTYKNIEHIIIDGGSSDNTIEIIKKHQPDYNMTWISEPDNGMYEAISKGFTAAHGEIFSWLNSDDMYLPWAVELVVKVMEKNHIDWCTGIPARWNKTGILHNIGIIAPVYSQFFIKKGLYHGKALGWIQQESTFWTRRLWEISGGINPALKYAGDFYLWKSFSKHTRIYTISSILAGFRKHKNQKTTDIDQYYKEIEKYCTLTGKILMKFQKLFFLILVIVNNKQFIRTRFLSETDDDNE